MTVALSARQLLFIHARLIAATGGEHGVLHRGLLQAAVAQPQALRRRRPGRRPVSKISRPD
jgi:hypothetical protein